MNRRWNVIATGDIRPQGAMFSAITSGGPATLHLQNTRTHVMCSARATTSLARMTSTDLVDYMIVWMVSARCTLFATSSANIDDGERWLCLRKLHPPMAGHISNFVKVCALCGLIIRFGVFCATTRGINFLLAETSFGNYDFSYLRIEFSTELNIEYAFENFTHSEHITNFVNAKVGNPWGLYGSNKRSEVSYATIRGIDCLLAKVRNQVASLSAAYHSKIYALHRNSRVQSTCCTSSSLLRVAQSSGTTMSQIIYLTPTPSAQGIARLLVNSINSDIMVQQLAGGRGHGHSTLLRAGPSSATTMTLRARNSMFSPTDFVWDLLLPSAPVICAQGRKRSRDNATTIGLFSSRHGKGLYGPESHHREGTHHQPLVRFERRQVGYRGNGQHQQFGRAHHKQQSIVGSKLKTSQGTSSLRRALLGQYDHGTSFAFEEECQHESSGGIASPGNGTSTDFLPLIPSSNINQFPFFGGFGGGGAVAQINNGHFPADNYTTAGIDMSAWSTSAVRGSSSPTAR
ncbi:hypothetical protein D6D01_08368 [Aureobasidium pullulans]|uniref:Mei2-like C-terminal RNA recognition motif domain-containing protein n=1 Tax=Aureobasidium pullulans TaxID=5580 RepID=A0A4S9KCW7_AURPU|nr:hypothetical protein D6D01_08368 [Aureobasidium pullulans]